MLRQTIFLNYSTDEELRMPVMPEDYKFSSGRQINNVDMAQTGEVNVVGLKTLLNQSLEFWLPAEKHPAASYWQEPFGIVETLAAWCQAGDVVGYIVTGTPVNVPIVIENVEYGEADGTNDVYLTLTVKEYRFLSAEETQSSGNEARSDANPAEGSEMQSYVIKSGDTLWAIADKFYGDGSLAYKLAGYNNIANANLIYAGNVLKIPNKAELSSATAVKGVSAPKKAEKSAVSVVSIQSIGKTNAVGSVDVTYTDADGIIRTKKNAVGNIFAQAGSKITITATGSATGTAKAIEYGQSEIDSGVKSGNVTKFSAVVAGNETYKLHWLR